MKALLLLVLVISVSGLPRQPRQNGEPEIGAEVIRLTNEKTPILLTSDNAAQDAENVIALDAIALNSTVPESQPPTPIPESVPITTEALPQNTPSLVPSVVDISTQNPNNTPPPPANATSAAPAEEDEESDEDSEEADEADEEDEEEDDEEEDEEEEDEADEEDEEDDAKAKKLLKKSKRDVAAEEVSHSFNEPETLKSEEEDEKVAPVGDVTGGKTSVVAQESPLQAETGTKSNEDDEAESSLKKQPVKITPTLVIT